MPFSTPSPDLSLFLTEANLPDRQTVRILVVGDLTRWKTLGRLHDVLADCDFVDLADLTDQTIRSTSPDLVVSPLVGQDFDATDVARRLRAARFAGRYCIVANDLPDVDLIYREIRSIAPQLTLDLINLPQKPAANPA